MTMAAKMPEKIRVLMISKACVVGEYQRKLEAIASYKDIDLTVLVPPAWRDERGTLLLERAHTVGYRLLATPIVFNGSYHLHFYPQLRRHLAAGVHIVHIDEEPYNLATWHALRQARRCGAKTLFFSWQNIGRRYPWPFSAMEQHVLHNADRGIYGSASAAAVGRAKGFSRELAVIPQFGVDPQTFTPPVEPRAAAAPFRIGYVGRLVPEKGVDILLQAAARLGLGSRVEVIGAGPQLAALQALAIRDGIGDTVSFTAWLPSAQMPQRLRGLDALVLPARTQPNWREQFGRVLVEAMACGVPVVGSTCGEIPGVIGDAGLVVPEDDVAALADALRRLRDDHQLRAELGGRGRARVLQHFTHAHIAAATVQVYRAMQAGAAPMLHSPKQ